MRLGVIVIQLINCEIFSGVRKTHLAKDNGCDNRHGIGVTMTHQDVII